MSATKLPDQAMPTNAPDVTVEYVPGIGETETRSWKFRREDVIAKYNELKGTAEAGGEFDGNVTGLGYSTTDGRSKVMLKLERNGVVNEYGNNVKLIEELYAVDVVRDVRAAPYFSTAAATKLTDDQVAWVVECVDKQYDEAQIDVEAVKYTPNKTLWGAWTDGMKQLRYHMNHGQDSYFETAFILRKSIYGVNTSQVQASFVGLNLVCTAAGDATHQKIPVFESAMDALINALPTGEWLYKPPQAEHLGKGKWRITLEWHWAEKWSKIYDGTWGL